MREETKKIISEVSDELRNGEITLETRDEVPWNFFVQMNVLDGTNRVSGNENVPTLNIADIENLTIAADSYLSVAREFYQDQKANYNLDEYNFNKKLIFDLLVNGTNYDLLNPRQYIDTRTKMLNTKVQEGKFNLDKIKMPFGWTSLRIEIKKNDSKLEGPYKFTPIFESDMGEFVAPSITFGIVEKTAVVYAIQAKKDKQENPLAKKMDRYFRKFNQDISEEEIEGKISPNALAAATIFFACMQRQGIKNIVAPAFLPARYTSALKSPKHKNLSDEERSFAVEKIDRDQYNMTNRFTYTFVRYATHFDGCEFNYNDDTQISYLTLSNKHQSSDNEIFGFRAQIDQQLKHYELSK